MSIENLLRQNMHYVKLGDGVHLYWQYQRETLCNRDKVSAERLYVADPDCEGCLAEVGRIVYGEMRK